jgi:hypothetical protein
MEKGEKVHVFSMVKPLFFSSMNITRLDDSFKKDLQERIENELNKK